jgi:hypothetical protein
MITAGRIMSGITIGLTVLAVIIIGIAIATSHSATNSSYSGY